MRLYACTLIALPLLPFAPWAGAASTVLLDVTGLIIPAACTPVLSSGGLVDYGKISQQDLNADRGTRLASRDLELSLECNGPVRFALRMRDNRDGTATVNSEIYYGLNLDPSGNRIGLYSVSFDPARTHANGLTQVYGTESTTGGVAWRSANRNPIDIGARSYLGFTDTEGSTAGPLALTDLHSIVKLDAVLNAKQNLDLSGDVWLDGSATLEVIYL